VRHPDDRPRWGWVALAVLTIAVVVLLAFSQRGSCADVAPGVDGQSSCTTGPVLGMPGTVVVVVAGALLTIHSLRRATRRDDGPT